MKKILPLFMILGLLTACGEKSIEVQTTTAILPPIVAPVPAPLTLRDVNFIVLNKAELEALIEKLNKNPDPNFVIYGLTNKDYENLSLNMQEIKRFMLEQRAVIRFYDRIEQSRSKESKNTVKSEDEKK